MNERWKTKHSRGLAKGIPIYAVIMPPGLTLKEQGKWKNGLRPVVGMNCWATVDDGWREQAQTRQEFQYSDQERRERELYGDHL
jgi:hypothetical protein